MADPAHQTATPTFDLPADISRNILETISDGIYLVDLGRRITYWNRAAEELSGFGRTEVLGRCCSDGILTHVDENGKCLCQDGCPLAATIADLKPRQADVFMHHRQGHRVPVCVRSFPLRDTAGTLCGAVEVFQENSAQQTAQKTIRTLAALAMTDTLTGLPNRRSLEIRLKAAFGEMHSFGTTLGLLLLDVDHLADFHKNFGHDLGDRAFLMLSKTIAGALQKNGIIGRWDAEELLALLYIRDNKELAALAEQTRMLVEHCYLETSRGIIRATVSVGAALATPDDTWQTLVEKAESCLFQSEAAGRNKVTLHRPPTP